MTMDEASKNEFIRLKANMGLCFIKYLQDSGKVKKQILSASGLPELSPAPKLSKEQDVQILMRTANVLMHTANDSISCGKQQDSLP